MLQLISYLAPSIPHGFFEVLARIISEGTGMDVHLKFNEQISGPLEGDRWGYNDRNSRSGWFSMVERIAPYSPLDYFSEIVQSGSHLESLRSVLTGKIDAAAIDSNALLYQVNQNQLDAAEFRVLETWGPFPIQPIVIRAGLQNSLKQAIRKSLLQAHEGYSAELSSFGFRSFAEAKRKDYL